MRFTRQLCLSLLALLALPVLGFAQGPAGVGASTGGSHPSSHGRSTSNFSYDTNWELAIGYQYNRINLIGSPFDTSGINVEVTRYFDRWIGVDAQLGAGFDGNTKGTTTPPNLGVHSLFIGAGPRLAYRNRSRIEPWVHAVFGLQDFRFTQTANGVLGSNDALGIVAGGGLNFMVTPHVGIRVEGDALETHFFSAYQRQFQVVGGFVFRF